MVAIPVKVYTRNLPAEQYLLDGDGHFVTGCSEKQSKHYREIIAVLQRELDAGKLARKSDAVALGGRVRVGDSVGE